GPTATSTITSAPDLTVTILGPTSLASGTISQNTLTIRNVVTASTTGTMNFTLTELPSGIATYPPSMTSSDWAATRTATGWTFTSVPSLVLAPGAQSTISFGLSVPAPGTTTPPPLTAQLPPGIGGETNTSNNTAQLAVSLT